MARKKKAFRSKPRTGLAAAPTTNFTAFSDYIRVEVRNFGVIESKPAKAKPKAKPTVDNDKNNGTE